MDKKISYYLKTTYGILTRRPCYYDETREIEVIIDKTDYDKLCNVKSFVVDQIRFTRKPKTEEENDTSLAVKFRYEFLDNDQYHDLITQDGRKKFGAVSPEGLFYQCSYSGHNDLEYNLCKRGLLNQPGNKSDCYGAFEWWGWLQLSGAMMTDCEWSFAFEVNEYDYTTKEDSVLKQNRLTGEQVKAIVDYTKSLGRDYVMFNHAWFNVDDIHKFMAVTNRTDMYDLIHELQIKVAEPREELDKGY